MDGRYSLGRRAGHVDLRRIYIGFCGKIIPLLEISSWKDNGRYNYICYSVEDIPDEFSIIKSRGDVKRFLRGDRTFPDYFVQYKCPVWKFQFREWRDGKHCDILTINPELKPLEFYRRYDCYQCYQEISMYVGGVLGNANPSIPHIDDKTMAEAKGFDKYSFRKDKQS